MLPSCSRTVKALITLAELLQAKRHGVYMVGELGHDGRARDILSAFAGAPDKHISSEMMELNCPESSQF